MCRKMSALGVLGGQQEQLGADRVGVLVAHLGAEEDDPLAQQTLVDVVVEDGDAGAPAGRVGRGRNLGHECDPSPTNPPIPRVCRPCSRTADFAWGGGCGRSALGDGLEPLDGPRHAGLELVGVVLGAAEQEPGEDPETIVSFSGTGRRCTTRVPSPAALISQIHRAPLDVVSQASDRPGSRTPTTLRVGHTTPLRRLMPRYHWPLRIPPRLERQHLDQLRAPVGHPRGVGDQRPDLVGRGGDGRLGAELTVGECVHGA